MPLHVIEWSRIWKGFEARVELRIGRQLRVGRKGQLRERKIEAEGKGDQGAEMR